MWINTQNTLNEYNDPLLSLSGKPSARPGLSYLDYTL